MPAFLSKLMTAVRSYPGKKLEGLKEFKRTATWKDWLIAGTLWTLIIGIAGVFGGAALIDVFDGPSAPRPAVAQSSSVAVAPPSNSEVAPLPALVTIDPSTCEGPRTPDMTVERTGSTCLITYNGMVFNQIVAVGGWCNQLQKTWPIEGGKFIIELAPGQDTGTADDFSFSQTRSDDMSLVVTTRGVREDQSGSTLCGESRMTKWRN
jgi:hypothetical protein